MGEHAGCRRGLRITPAPMGKAMGSRQQRPRMRPTSIPAAEAAPGEEEGAAGEEPGEPRGTSPPPQSAGCQRSAPQDTVSAGTSCWWPLRGSGERPRSGAATSAAARAGAAQPAQASLSLFLPRRLFSGVIPRAGPWQGSATRLRWRGPRLCLHPPPGSSLSALPGSARAAVIAAPRSSPRSPRPGVSSPLEEPREAAAGRRLSGHPPSLLALRRALVRGRGQEKQVRAPKLQARPPEGEEAASSS